MGIFRSGYYNWKQTREKRDERECEYAKQVREVFTSGEGTYGANRVCGKLRQEGYSSSFYKVREYMDIQELYTIHCKRRQKSLTDSRRSRGDGYFNLTKGLDIHSPFQVLSCDISYIRTGEGVEYLCQIKDVKSGIILSQSMENHMRAELVVKTIRKATKCWNIPIGSIFHSDRGSQYTSESVKNLLIKEGIRQSFSRVSMPGEGLPQRKRGYNSWSESFFANLKKEAIHRVYFRTRAEARLKIFNHIEGFYNTRRIQKRLGNISPMQWLIRWNQSLQTRVA